jgi:hypothetical protein
MFDDVRSMVDRRALIAGVVGLVLGSLFGWMVLGWVAFPVTWTDADPWDLRPDQKEVYVALVADSYSINQDGALARQQLQGFGKAELADVLAGLVEEAEQSGDTEQRRRLQQLATVVDVAPSAETPVPQPTPSGGTTGLLGSVRTLLPLCGLGILVLVIVVVIAVIIFRILQRGPSRPAEIAPAEEEAYEPGRAEALGRFVTTYELGDDGYDTSFNIETTGPRGEFFGACGVGFSEVLGEGSPDKIAAFEVWLFDKTDMDNVQTVTKVLMSEFAYNSQELREKMKDRGEAVLVEEGKVVSIEGIGLELRAEILEFQYGRDPSLPPDSYFQKLTTELVPSFNL